MQKTQLYVSKETEMLLTYLVFLFEVLAIVFLLLILRAVHLPSSKPKSSDTLERCHFAQNKIPKGENKAYKYFQSGQKEQKFMYKFSYKKKTMLLNKFPSH